MKINIEFDMTPEEFRRVMGLPEGYDVMSLFKPMMAENMKSVDQVQKTFVDLMSGYMKGGTSPKSSNG